MFFFFFFPFQKIHPPTSCNTVCTALYNTIVVSLFPFFFFYICQINSQGILILHYFSFQLKPTVERPARGLFRCSRQSIEYN